MLRVLKVSLAHKALKEFKERKAHRALKVPLVLKDSRAFKVLKDFREHKVY